MSTSLSPFVSTLLVALGLLAGACGDPEPLPANPEQIAPAASSGGDLDSLFEDEGMETEGVPAGDADVDEAADEAAEPADPNEALAE